MQGLPRAFSIIADCAGALAPASAAEKLRVGKAVAFAWTFTPLDVGMQTGIFAKHGVEIEASAFNGDARMQQGLTSDSIDIGIGSGPGMAFMVKGVPAKAVAAMAGVPHNMAVMVGYNLPIRTVDDLKGKKLGVTTVGSLTDWIGKRIGTLKGWGPAGITTVPIGGMPPARAAIKTGQLDGYIGALEVGYYARGGQGMARHHQRRAVRRPFHHPRVLRARGPDRQAAAGGERLPPRLAGHHRLHEGNKDKTVEITSKVINVSPAIVARAYDEQIGIFSADCTFDPKAITVLKQSFIEMGLLKEIPDDKAMFTTQFCR